IPDKFHTTFHLWEDGVKDYMLTDVVEIHFIEMEKFRKLRNKNLKEDKLQRWLSFFREDISKQKLSAPLPIFVTTSEEEQGFTKRVNAKGYAKARRRWDI
ncbi:MAG TPA: PD-(D/E)XK nuclease family transposase, partial [Clostridium sp.]|uniref:PD-(D/E)XK nuclease family transposase n=1 Tax=Clostridium sp. TaxID=1506 RepID=UPI002F935B82